jgi:DNA-binding transcriptional regulator LsrR (DeoR family)
VEPLPPRATSPPLSDEALEHLRLVVKVAHLYHQRGLNQPRIAKQLRISQARVSRLLKLAAEKGIVRTSVHVPPGMFTAVEDAIEERYGIPQVVVVDTGSRDEELLSALGASAAAFLEEAIPTCKVIGLSSWSETLLAAVDAMHPLLRGQTEYVVQVLGGVGSPESQVYATRLTERLARIAHAQPVFLLGPGVVSSASARQALLRDPHFAATLAFYDRLSMVLVGIGSLARPSRVLRENVGVIGEADQQRLAALGAVGDICMRFFDAQGNTVSSPLDDRVIAISVNQLKKTPRTVAVAGGPAKFEAIRAALRGKWVDTLITDLGVAQRLVDEP